MPSENLTTIEAQVRAHLIRVDDYDVMIDLTTGHETFATVTTVRFTGQGAGETFIDLIADSVESIEVNGRLLDPAHAFGESRVQLPVSPGPNLLRIASTQRYTNTGEGLHRFVDPADGEIYLHTQFEVAHSRRVFAVFEQPDLKATFTFTVTAPARWEVVSTQPTPDPVTLGEKDGEKIARWVFPPTPVISSYVTALIAGPFRAVRSTLQSRDGRTIPLGIFSRRSLAESLDADYVFDKTREGFEFFEELFDFPYPFEKYDQLFVPELSAGAMENVGAVTFIEDFIFRGQVSDAKREGRVATILHELAHMWFGNLVTMRWWDDLWLNESFAEYVSVLATVEATEWAHGWTSFASSDKAWAYRQDQLPSTHPIVSQIHDLEDVLHNFDGITYAKGASVLKQLVAWVGREAFMGGVHDYFVAHHHANTGLADFLAALEARSGRELKEWSALWLETAGVNTLRGEHTLDSSGRYASFAISQTACAAYPAIRSHRIALGFYERDGDTIRRTRRIELDVEGACTSVPELVGAAPPDLLLLNDDDLTFAKIRLDERSLRTAEEQLGRVEAPLARALIWGMLWDATRDAEYPASRFIEVVLAHVAHETGSTTLRTLLGQLAVAVEQYTLPEMRLQVRADVADDLWRLADEAAPGSDAQFQYASAFGQLAITDSQLDIVGALRDGARALPGLQIDTDFAWAVSAALAAGGRVSGAQVDRQLAQDQTAAGARAAARVRAAMPTTEGKARAWSAVFDSSEESNHMVEAIGAGFLQVNDPSLLQPYAERFFDEILSAWESRGSEIGEQLVEGFYPSPFVSSELLEATRRWLGDHHDGPPGLLRLVTERLSDVERAVAVQQFESAHRQMAGARHA